MRLLTVKSVQQKKCEIIYDAIQRSRLALNLKRSEKEDDLVPSLIICCSLQAKTWCSSEDQVRICVIFFHLSVVASD
jgi:hypothetical protein